MPFIEKNYSIPKEFRFVHRKMLTVTFFSWPSLIPDVKLRLLQHNSFKYQMVKGVPILSLMHMGRNPALPFHRLIFSLLSMTYFSGMRQICLLFEICYLEFKKSAPPNAL